MAVYTSAFWHPRVARMVNDELAIAVGICLYPPRTTLEKYGYELADNVRSLAPSRKIFKIDDFDEFRKPFRHQLHCSQNHIFERLAGLDELADGKHIILLCFDPVGKPGQWCHREIVAEWLEQHDISCTEL
jgi:uncharacterized protein YeaO (DUF488 family)